MLPDVLWGADMERRMRSVAMAMVLGLAALAGAGSAGAREVSVAVAANFSAPAQEIAAAFQKATGDRAVLSFGATGQLDSQIRQGAPFEVFLSADMERPRRLVADGKAGPSAPVIYARGRLALYSTRPELVDDRGEVLRRGGFSHLAIADPAVAPYGAAAVELMRRRGVHDALKPRLVLGASIGQAFTFVSTGAADLGFVSLSQLVGVTGGSRWVPPTTDYPPIEQGAVITAAGSGDPAAARFLAYLQSAEARAIIRRYGYDVN
jgi:molybdate transport system substrate-binding protein